jgi:hypothetical protein
MVASQPGNASYNPAPPPNRDIVIANAVARRMGRAL